MSLHELRSTPPLRDADFAAIRARVNAQIDEDLCGGGRLARPGVGWLFTFAATAAAAIVIAVFLPQKPTALPHQPPRVVQKVPVPSPIVPELLEPPQPPAIRTIASPHKRQSVPAKELRINLQTADPNIRIIWIVNPKNLKEES